VWDEGKYPTMSPLKEIVGTIQSQVAKIEDDMKVTTPFSARKKFPSFGELEFCNDLATSALWIFINSCGFLITMVLLIAMVAPGDVEFHPCALGDVVYTWF
jgi:hypothetical protein